MWQIISGRKRFFKSGVLGEDTSTYVIDKRLISGIEKEKSLKMGGSTNNPL